MVLLLGLAFAIGKTGVILLFAFASFAGLREFLTLTSTRRGDHWALAAAFFVVLPLQYYLIWIEWYGLYSIFIPVYVLLLPVMLPHCGGDATHFMERIADLAADDRGVRAVTRPGVADLADPRL
jgi:phosphatidate cytidylyltransferase